MKIAITGATGYIGQRLILAALRAGHEVLALSRRPPASRSSVKWYPFDLADTMPLSFPHDLDAVYHLAADTRHPQGADQVERTAAQRLINAAGVIGAKFVFISSQTARANAPTGYGRIKWQIERLTLEAGGWVIRPGQVYGGPERGLFGQLCGILRHLPVLPVFFPAPVVQPVHVDDLAAALLACPALGVPTMLCVGAPGATNFTTFLKAIVRGRTGGRQPLCIPVPTMLIRGAGWFLGPRLNAQLGFDRLSSLFTLPQMDTEADLERLKLTLRPLSSGMSRSGRCRRELLREAHILLTYVLRMPPASLLMRRYVRAIEAFRTGRALRLPQLILRFPALLALLDGAGCVEAAFRSELVWRLNTAVMLAEASPQGARRFLGLERVHGWKWSALRMTLAIMSEFVRRMVQLFLRPILACVGRRGTFQ